jgi:hypothetical protein
MAASLAAFRSHLLWQKVTLTKSVLIQLNEGF